MPTVLVHGNRIVVISERCYGNFNGFWHIKGQVVPCWEVV